MMAYLFFLLTSAILFIRPAEINYALFGGLPLFEICIIPCIVMSSGKLLAPGPAGGISKSPVAVCFLAYFAAMVTSNVANGQLDDAWITLSENGKPFLYFALLMLNLDTEGKLVRYLKVVVLLALVAAGVAILDYKGIIRIDREKVVEYQSNAEGVYLLERLSGTGLFGDPNDMASLMATMLLLCLYFLTRGDASLVSRASWVPIASVFAYALKLTSSRGGLLALMVGLTALMLMRFGKKAAILLPAIPLALMAVGGRQASISLGSGTGQSRIQLQHIGMATFVHHPIFGIGNGHYLDIASHVAHNSFVQALTESGLLGGICFVGAYYCAITALWEVRTHHQVLDRNIEALGAYLIAVMVTQMVAKMSLTQNTNMSTHVFLGIAGAYPRVCLAFPPVSQVFDMRTATRVLIVGLAATVFLFIFVNVMVRY